MAIEEVFKHPWSMAWSLSTYLFEAEVSPFRDVREGESLAVERVIVAELGYTFVLAIALIETVVRAALCLIGVPLSFLLPDKKTVSLTDPSPARHAVGATSMGTICSALTAINCLKALVQNFYKPRVEYSTLCC